LADRVRIDATELLDVRLSSDRTRVVLRLRDQGGQSVSLSLPTACLNTVMTAMPQQIDAGTVDASGAGDLFHHQARSGRGNGDDRHVWSHAP